MPPVVTGPNPRVLMQGASPPLGVGPCVYDPSCEVRLEDGEGLLLCTDGLVERRDEDLDAVAEGVKRELGGLDFVVHAVAFAQREELDGAFVDTSREGYRLAQDISSYSLTALARRTAPLMEGGGSIVTLSYLGGERVVPHYNVMGVAKAALEMSVRYLASDLGPQGVRVNAISAGPIKTIAASGVHGISKMLEYHRQHAPLRRNTEQDEVGDAALFLVSPLSRGVTGEVIHVDGGFHVMGMAAL